MFKTLPINIILYIITISFFYLLYLNQANKTRTKHGVVHEFLGHPVPGQPSA